MRMLLIAIVGLVVAGAGVEQAERLVPEDSAAER
jgi:hypothetical protein